MILEKGLAEFCPRCSLQRHCRYDFVLRRVVEMSIPVGCKTQADCKAEIESLALGIAPTASRPVGRLL